MIFLIIFSLDMVQIVVYLKKRSFALLKKSPRKTPKIEVEKKTDTPKMLTVVTTYILSPLIYRSDFP